jgi:hypothetical protein
MNFKECLAKEHSKKVTNQLVNQILKEPSLMNEFMEVFLGDSHRITQRAAWVLSYLAEKEPQIVMDYLPVLVEELSNPKHHQAVRRNILRAVQYMDIPEDVSGELLDTCFILLNKKEEQVAVKVFSMNVILRMAKKYPEIGRELCLSIEEQIAFQSTAFKNRGRKILKELGNR